VAKDYIIKLTEQRKTKDLELAIEDAFLSPTKAVVFKMAEKSEICIVITDREFRCMGAFRASEFDCRPIDKKVLPYDYKDMPSSPISCHPPEVRRVYLRFMKKTFDTYASDYRTYLNKQADYDLGETTSL